MTAYRILRITLNQDKDERKPEVNQNPYTNLSTWINTADCISGKL